MTSWCGGRWFVVLPDHEAAPAVFERLRPYACRVVPHASGRPWLLGCWPKEESATAAAGADRALLIGRVQDRPAGLTPRGLATELPGSFHLLVSRDGRVLARGTCTGDRRLYTARVRGLTVAADRASTLAWLTGAGPDPARLAAGLLVPCVPYPLNAAPVWAGVDAVRPGDALHLETDGTARTGRWWQAPPADLPLEQAARGLREALRAAVAARVRPGELWGADLSGGMDSTSLCFLAHEAGARLVALTMELSAVGSQDARYAREAARQLPGVTHLTVPTGELAALFAGLEGRNPPADGPTALVRNRAQQEDTARLLLGHGAPRRLCGHGGDDVVTPPPAYLHRLLRHRPLTALRHAAAHRAALRWPLRATAAQLLSRRGPAGRLAAQAAALDGVRRGAAPACDWGPRPALPPWVTPGARELVAERLRALAEGCEPLGRDRGTHAWVQALHGAGRLAFQIAEGSERAGLPADMPFCDDAVFAACLRARPEEAGHPARFKPLLTAAMRGIVPEAILRRTTKDRAGDEWHAGLRAQRRTLASWAEDSRLAALGLADPAVLRRVLLAPALLTAGVAELEPTLAAEEWLRDVEAHSLARPPSAPAPPAAAASGFSPHPPPHLKEHRRDPSAGTARPAASP
ncbi:asparagine synthase-related protein [Streptomyces hoynatensis]|uniref:Asparagine synthetase domain-containing protein n=1 Tax=Streptomyces hoynatensis TaxID=1141874 RepID=A0A3A9Z8H1_9ACTN|nr:asparagine synthase-related protein [Streptomyces hoynatensis]RKN44665.1 hypothetical protein D7294_05850 [Streptomyces hoynatensis]